MIDGVRHGCENVQPENAVVEEHDSAYLRRDIQVETGEVAHPSTEVESRQKLGR